VTPKDTLDRIVDLARQEGALTPAKLRRFLGALRDRARLVLEERVEPLAKRAEAFEKESHWRAEIQRGLEESVASLQGELEWRAGIQSGLEGSVASLQDELRWRQAAMEGLEAEIAWRAEEVEARRHEVGRLLAQIEGLGEEWRTATATHDRLLAHHRSVVARMAATLETVTTWLPWSYKRARARIADLAAALRKELP
jgi:chromosome segregation ATPase